MKEITKLNTKKVDDQTISLLKELLEKAENGELSSLIYIDKYHNGSVGHGWAGKPDNKMIGKIEELKFDFYSQAYFPMPKE